MQQLIADHGKIEFIFFQDSISESKAQNSPQLVVSCNANRVRIILTNSLIQSIII